MNPPPYFNFYPADWLESDRIFCMTLEQEGAYIRLLAAMWRRGGTLKDDPRLICHILRCRPAKWKKIRAALVDELGVIQESENTLFNEKLSQTYQVFVKKREKSVRSANKRWANEAKTTTKKERKNNKPTHANAMRTQCYTDTDTDTDTIRKETIKEKKISGSPTRRIRCPHLQIVAEYNSILSTLPTVNPKLWKQGRRKLLFARWAEDEERQKISWWKDFFQKVSRSPFLMGEVTTFVASLDWLLKEANFIKVLEGRYDPREQTIKKPADPKNFREAQAVMNDTIAHNLNKRHEDGTEWHQKRIIEG